MTQDIKTTKCDIQEQLGRSTIQHGPLNNRIYLMKLHPEDSRWIVPELDRLARGRGYGKMIAKVTGSAAGVFENAGYRREAVIPGFFPDGEEAVFLGKYPDPDRAEETCLEEMDKILAAACSRRDQGPKSPLDVRYVIEEAEPGDTSDMAALYRAVFPSYPFPIHDPAYLADTMKTHIRYFCAREKGKIAALASCEMDKTGLNVEMTDFATGRDHLGRGLAVHLLAGMEREMTNSGMHIAYTIARALSAGMNITFARLGYEFCGTLTNNTDISGAIESMNVWYKRLGED